MVQRQIIFLAFILTALLSVAGCSGEDVIVQDQEMVDQPLESRSADSHIVYLVHTKKASISSSKVVSLFLSGWRFQNHVTISGYTATDDLWTILSKVSKNTDFDVIKIEVAGVNYGSVPWLAYLEDVCEMVGTLDQIIVLDQDLETELSCKG